MRKIRFRYIKENGKSTSVTVRCSLKRNASLISEALRHYQRLERQNDEEISTKKLDKQNRRHYHQGQKSSTSVVIEHNVTNNKIRQTTNHRPFDPIQLRRKQCSSTLIDEDLPRISNASSSSSSGFRSHSSNEDIENVNQRSNIIKEIYKTEYDYLKHLKNLVECYLKRMRLRTDLFSVKQIEILMGNLEEIYDIQQSFFQLLKYSIDQIHPYQSLIGKCFLLFKEDFKKYADYCTNQPLSCLELTKLENNPIYRQFFESCRLQANMIELKLDAFLLTPIQRICQYPLQLNELLKLTSQDHKDYHDVQQALNAMRNVASYINERKRRIEYREILHKWQNTIENWQGKDLRETCSQGLGHVDAYLIENGKKESVILFLFDHLLIICRKDRRNTLTYIARIDLDNAEIEKMFDENLFTWRLYDRIQDKIFHFAHRTSLERMQIFDALEYERALVEENSLENSANHFYTQLTTLKIEPYLTNQQSTRSFTKQNRSISTILRTSLSPCNNRTSSLLITAFDHTPKDKQKLSLPKFVRCSSPDTSIDESFRSIKSRFRFCS